jgi:hypothetical protein
MKIVEILVTIIGILLILPLIGVDQLMGAVTDWIIALAVLVIGIGKLAGKM